jgi:rhodanese-related sulfurtransferase
MLSNPHGALRIKPMRAIIGLLILILAAGPASPEVLTAKDARARAEAGELTIVDSRLPVEWAETGLPEGGEGVSLQDPATLQIRPEFADDVLRAVGGDRDRPIGLICARGNRSALATALLARAGFTEVHDIGEGMIGGDRGPGWLARDLPTEPCTVC